MQKMDVLTAGQKSIFLDAEKHMGGLAPIGDKYRPLGGGFLGAAGVLVEFAAGW